MPYLNDFHLCYSWIWNDEIGTMKIIHLFLQLLLFVVSHVLLGCTITMTSFVPLPVNWFCLSVRTHWKFTSLTRDLFLLSLGALACLSDLSIFNYQPGTVRHAYGTLSSSSSLLFNSFSFFVAAFLFFSLFLACIFHILLAWLEVLVLLFPFSCYILSLKLIILSFWTSKNFSLAFGWVQLWNLPEL